MHFNPNILSFILYPYHVVVSRKNERFLIHLKSDNPKDYADGSDARQYDHRLRGPVDEGIELAIDPQTGMKNYIANEHIPQLSSGETMHTSGESF